MVDYKANLEKLYHQKSRVISRLYQCEHDGEEVKRERIQAEMDVKAVWMFVDALVLHPRRRGAEGR